MDDRQIYQSAANAEEPMDVKRRKARASVRRMRRTNRLFFRLITVLVSAVIVAVAFYLFQSHLSNEPDTLVTDLQAFSSETVSRLHLDRFFSASQAPLQPQAATAVAPQADTLSAAQAPATEKATEKETEKTAPTEKSEPSQSDQAASPAQQADQQANAAASATLSQAAALAAGYDYDAAIALAKSIPGYDTNSEAQSAVADFEKQRDSCVPADVNTVPHIFYHSLLNDTNRAFNVEVLGQFAVDGMNAWMTTIEEFDAITQQLYDNGYVYVRLRDLVVETTDASGQVSFQPNTQLMLPPGKKPIVLSVDDLSYYHSYYKAGFPDKLVLDENGQVKCSYTDSAGNTSVGDYDVVPRLNTFLAAHPDGAYKGARGLIAMTGYNGVFGYRTDADYEEQTNLMEDQAAYLAAHPEFNRQEEIAQATVIANAIKDEGWEFASHTWGHLSVTGASVEKLRTDNEKWVANVGNIVGPVDTIIFAHGNDIGSWEGYTDDNEQYAYYNSAGYHFYCNVDGSVPYWVQIAPAYVRQGRIDLDGYMLYQASTGQTTVLDQLFNASEVFDQRRPTPVVANGQA